MEKRSKKLNLGLTFSATFFGNTLEWYDYSTFGLAVPIFAHIFFINTNPFLALLQTFLVYAIGSISRPLGGAFFGFIGDRFGRRVSLISSISFMTVPIFLIGMLPTYQQIGLAAPLLLACLRFCQGIAAGGEFPIAAAFLVESSPPAERGFFGSFAFFGIFLGVLIGTLSYLAIDARLSEAALYAWGWRIPFLIGTGMGCLTFYLRRKLHESPIYQECQRRAGIVKNPVKEVFRKYKSSLGQVIGLCILETVIYNILIIYLMVYLNHFLQVPFKTALMLHLLFLFFLLIFIPLMGRVAHFFGCRTIAIFGACGFLFFSYPLFGFLSHPIFMLKIMALIVFAIFFASYYALLPTFFSDLFPTPVRCSGIGLGYNLTIACIGGSTPLINLYCMELFKTLYFPAYYLMGAALISLFFLMRLKDKVPHGLLA